LIKPKPNLGGPRFKSRRSRRKGPQSPTEAVFSRIISACSSANELNGSIITLERRATPNEIVTMVDVLRSVKWTDWEVRVAEFANKVIPRKVSRKLRLATRLDLDASITRWISQLESDQVIRNDWDRTFITKGMALYRNSQKVKERVLLVGFTGTAQRLMLPLHRFLNSVNDLGVDVLIVWAKERSEYNLGIPSLGADFRSSLAALERLVRGMGYPRHGVIGTSGGGAPAVIFALGYMNTPYIVVGSQHPERPKYFEEWTRISPALGISQKKPEGVALVGDEAPQKDLDAAEYLRRTVGARVRRSPGGHNPVYNLAQQGKLGPLIAEAILERPKGSHGMSTEFN